MRACVCVFSVHLFPFCNMCEYVFSLYILVIALVINEMCAVVRTTSVKRLDYIGVYYTCIRRVHTINHTNTNVHTHERVEHNVAICRLPLACSLSSFLSHFFFFSSVLVNMSLYLRLLGSTTVVPLISVWFVLNK